MTKKNSPLEREKVHAIYKYIVDYYSENAKTPGYRAIMEQFNISSLSVVHYYMAFLIEHGYIYIKDKAIRLPHYEAAVKDSINATKAQDAYYNNRRWED